MYADALKAKTLELRKAKDPLATFLIAVGSKAKDLAKAEDPTNAEVTDDHALRAINSFVKSADDVLDLLGDQKDSPAFTRASAELALLRSFLPAEASDEDVRGVINEYIDMAEGMQTVGPKMMGPIMAYLNKTFGAALNKRKASGLIQTVLAERA